MAQERLSPHDRTVVTVGGTAAVVYALVLPYLWEGALNVAVVGSSGVGSAWLRVILSAVPMCLALAVLVLTGRAFVGVAIAAAAAVALACSSIVYFGGIGLGPADYAAWIGSSLVGACALLGADFVVWRWGSGTPALGALAGAAAGVASFVLTAYQLTVNGDLVALRALPIDYWLREYGGTALILTGVGAVAGAVAQRLVVRQETAGRV